MDDVNILFVSDEKSILQKIEDLLKKENYGKYFAESRSDAAGVVKTTPIHILLADMAVPEMDDLALLKSIKERQTDLIAIVLSDKNQMVPLISHLNTGEIFRFVSKPLELTELKAAIADAIEMYLFRQDKAELVTTLKKQNKVLGEALNHQKDVEHKLELLCINDDLTGLFNHHQINTALQKEFLSSKRYNNDFSCLVLDIDYFKMVNGTYGREFGDVVLKKLGTILKDAIRSVDIAFRYGGEEFFILLPHTNIEEAGVVGERILQACRKTSFKHEDISHDITLSIGGASSKSCQATSAEDILSAAERLLKKAKNDGRNRVEIS